MIYHRPVHKTDTAGMLTSHKNATERQRVAKNGTRLANAESACSRATQRVRRRVSPHFFIAKLFKTRPSGLRLLASSEPCGHLLIPSLLRVFRSNGQWIGPAKPLHQLYLPDKREMNVVAVIECVLCVRFSMCLRCICC